MLTVTLRAAVIAAVLLAAGCVTTPPDPLRLLPPTGSVVITSSLPGAAIWVDGVNTGRSTPDTLTLSEGTHQLLLRLTGFADAGGQITVTKGKLQTYYYVISAEQLQRLVLLEDFGNVSCVPCSLSNLVLEAVKTNTYGTDKLAVIKYPINFPLPTDPFYLHAKDYSAPRVSYYNIFSAPTTFVDGIVKPASSDSSSIKNAIAARLVVQPKFLITVTDTVTGGAYSVAIAVTVLDSAGISTAQLVLHTAITETDFVFATPPGSNGETKFYDVMRAMLPSGSGETIAAPIPGKTTRYTRGTAVSSAWNLAHTRTIVFIQNRITKEILQAAATRQ